MQQQPLLSQTHPGGFYVGFVGPVEPKAAQALIAALTDGFRAGYKEVNLLMASPGGVIEVAFYVSHVLASLPVKLITYNVGGVGSCGNTIFLTGVERYAAPHTAFFFHQSHVQAPPELTSSVLKLRTKFFALDDARTADYTAQRTGQQRADVDGWLTGEALMDPDEAVAKGVAHAIKAPQIPANAFFHQVPTP